MTTNTSIQSGTQYLSAAVAPGGTAVLPYPVGYSQANFTGANAGAATDNVLFINDNDRYPGSQFTVAYGASNITITNNSSATWPAGAKIRVGYALLNQGPIIGGKGAAITPVSDNTGGTASSSAAAITAGASYTQADMVAVKNALSSIIATQTQMLAEMKQAGVTN